MSLAGGGISAALGVALLVAGLPALSLAQEPEPKAQPPGQVVVDAEAAERALERSLVQAGGLLLRPGRLELEPSLRYARQEVITVAATGGLIRRDIDEVTADLVLRVGLPLDSQLELGLPYHWRRVEEVREVGFSAVDDASASGAGAGDLRLGVAKTLLREAGRRPDLIARVTWDTRTGTGRDDGVRISSDFHELRASFTAIKRQDPLVFLGGLAFQQVLERDDVQPGAAVTPSIGAFVALSPQTSMRFVVSNTFREETEVSGDDVPGSDQTAATLTVGGSSVLGRDALVNLSVGIGLTDDADDASLRLSFPIRF